MRQIIIIRTNTSERLTINYQDSWDLATVERVCAAIDETLMKDNGKVLGSVLEIYPIESHPGK